MPPPTMGEPPPAPAPAAEPARQLWAARPTPYGAPAAVEGLGGIVAPLLAGFSLTLLGLVVQAEDDLRWPDLALLLLSLAVVLLVLVVQFAFRARQHATTPAQAKEWWPDFDHDPERQQRVYQELAVYAACHAWWTTRARALYNTAVCVLLLGLAVVLVPTHPLGPLRAAGSPRS
jgi:MFS family permease